MSCIRDVRCGDVLYWCPVLVSCISVLYWCPVLVSCIGDMSVYWKCPIKEVFYNGRCPIKEVSCIRCPVLEVSCIRGLSVVLDCPAVLVIS